MRHRRTVKRTLIASLFTLLAFAACVSLPGTAKIGLGGPAMAGGDYAIDQFYGELAPHGEWVHHPRYNYVWLPRAVDPGWRPYSVGQWLSTDEYGWYWDSPEPFAWAVYHYGRWAYEYDYGWYWVPGDTWAPAWVQWRYGTDYVGWAPVGPSSYGGYAYGGPASYARPPRDDSWIFVRQAYLTSNVLYRHVVPRNNLTIAFNHTTYVVRPHYRNGRVYNYGMPRDRWSRITHQRAYSHKIHRGNHKYRAHGSKSRHGSKNWRGRDLHVYAPGVRKGAKPRHAPKRVHHRPHNGKGKANAKARANALARANIQARARADAKQFGKLHGGSSYNLPVANPRNARGPAGKANQKARAKQGASKSNAARTRAVNAKAANARATNAKAARARAARANANKANMHRGQPNRPNAHRGQPNWSKAGRPRNAHTRPPAKAKAANAKAANTRAVNAKAAHARAANVRKANARNANARNANARTAKARAANQRAGQAKAARAKPARAKASKANVNRARAANAKAANVKAANARAAHARAAKAKPAKARPPKARTANARSGGHRGPGSGGKGKKGAHQGGGNRASACKANPKLPYCGRRGG